MPRQKCKNKHAARLNFSKSTSKLHYRYSRIPTAMTAACILGTYVRQRM